MNRRYPCGTNEGYYGHLHRGETTCSPCRDAHNTAHRKLYRTNPLVRDRKRWGDRTRAQALRILQGRYSAEAFELLRFYSDLKVNRLRTVRETLRQRYPSEFESILNTVRKEVKS